MNTFYSNGDEHTNAIPNAAIDSADPQSAGIGIGHLVEPASQPAAAVGLSSRTPQWGLGTCSVWAGSTRVGTANRHSTRPKLVVSA